MYTIAIHNCGVGVLPIAESGYSRNKPATYDKYTSACTVAKSHADAHKVMCCVHNERGKIVKSYRPSATAGHKDKRVSDEVDNTHLV